MYAVNEAVVYLCMDSASLSAGGGGDSAHTDGQRMVLKIYGAWFTE